MRFLLARKKSVLMTLAFVGLIAWRIWIIPRIDSRLAGRWQCITPTPGREFVTLYLRGEGRGHHTWQEGDAACAIEYPWAVSGRTLQMHFQMDSGRHSRGLEHVIDKVIFLFERHRRVSSGESWTLLSVARDELRMRQRGTSQVQTFRRIPSGLDP